MRQYKSLILFLILTGAAGVIGSQFTPGDWYAALNKPSFNPPNWLFAPVWSVLYAMMAIAAWRVWRKEGTNITIALWALQLIINGLWSWIFFGINDIGLALIDILILVALVALLTNSFMQRDRMSGYLMVPYLVWILFASVLNFSLWVMNPNA